MLFMDFDSSVVGFIVSSDFWKFEVIILHIIGCDKFVDFCRVLNILPNLRELPLVLVSTNTTQILQACKQMECDNNKH